MTKTESVQKEGVSGLALGENPLTIWLLSTCIIVYLYIRRSNLGIDLHPAESKPATNMPKQAPHSIPVRIPILPPAGIDWSGKL